MAISRRARDAGKRTLHRAFRVGQRVGVDVLPRHFYSSVPDIRALRDSNEWRIPSELPGIRGTELDGQVAEAESWFTEPVRATLRSTDVHAEACAANEADGYGPMEAQFLEAFTSTKTPGHVVQVGAGVSTAIVLAAKKRHQLDVKVTCIDPFPTPLLQRLAASGDITLLREPAQVVPMSVFTDLGAGDLLFIDSTHTVKAGSEVNRLILEVLPRLAAGVTVHFHDIMFPYDYPPHLLDSSLFFWNESTLLQAFLTNNERARILVSESMLVHGRPDALASLLTGYQPVPVKDGLFTEGPGHFPSATWLAIE